MQEMLKRNKLVLISILTILISVILDLYTKQLVLDGMPLYSRSDLIDGFISITHSKNYGAAFSLLHNAPDWFRQPFFIIVRLLVMALVVVIMVKGKNSVKNIVAFSLILGGAMGNLISSIVYGFVTDFIDIKITSTYHWPTFNIADIAITVGVIMIFMDMFKIELKKRKAKVTNTKRKRKKK